MPHWQPSGSAGVCWQDLHDRRPCLHAGRHEHAGHEREVERHVALVAIGPEVLDDVGRPLVRLGQQHPAGEDVVDLGPQPPQELVRLGEVLAVRPGPLEQVGHGVEAEAVEPDVEPELDHVHHGVADVGVVVVQVGLVVEEPVPVELAAGVVIGPVRRFGVDEDDAGVLVDLVAVGPHVPVGHGPVTARGATPGTTDAGRTCGSSPGRRRSGCPWRAPPRPGGRRRRGRRSSDGS